MSETDADRLADLIRAARRILVFTGAGISTASGIPDFRGPSGVWKTRKPVYYQDFLASEEARIEYWDWKLEGWDAYRDAEPNAVHHACVDLEKAGRLLLVVTQNVDGLHRKAGLPEERLVEMHGTESRVACQECGGELVPGPHYESFRETRVPPRCSCGGPLKPATISFGQSLLREDERRSLSAAAETDLVISLGSSLLVYPAAAVPLAAAEHRGVPYAIVNRGTTGHDGEPFVTLRIDADVVEVFPAAVERAG